MIVTYQNNIKKINGRTLEEVLKNLESDDMYYESIKTLFIEVNTLRELKIALKSIHEVRSPAFIISLIMQLLGYPMPRANEIAEDVLLGRDV